MSDSPTDLDIVKRKVQERLRNLGYSVEKCEAGVDLLDSKAINLLLIVRDGSGNGMWTSAVLKRTGKVLVFDGFVWRSIGLYGRRVFLDVEVILQEGIVLE